MFNKTRFIAVGRVPILFGLLSIVAIATVVSGCYDSDLPGLASYDIKVSGLNGLSGSGNARIYIPMPMEGDAPLFPSNESLWIDPNGWSSYIAGTEHGTMYCLYTNNTSLANVSAQNTRTFFNMTHGDEIAIIQGVKKAPFHPVSSGTAPYTRWLSSDFRKKNYTSYVYLEGIKPSDDSATIDFYLELHVSDRSIDGLRSEWIIADILEDIPANASGWVPVTVQIRES